MHTQYQTHRHLQHALTLLGLQKLLQLVWYGYPFCLVIISSFLTLSRTHATLSRRQQTRQGSSQQGPLMLQMSSMAIQCHKCLRQVTAIECAQ